MGVLVRDTQVQTPNPVVLLHATAQPRIPHFAAPQTGRITFYVKGADTVMGERIRRSDWMEEEVRAWLRATRCRHAP